MHIGSINIHKSKVILIVYMIYSNKILTCDEQAMFLFHAFNFVEFIKNILIGFLCEKRNNNDKQR